MTTVTDPPVPATPTAPTNQTADAALPPGGARVAIVGGIFDRDAEYRARRNVTPETVLAEGLRAAGWDAHGVGHHAFDPAAGWDLVHVNHIGRSALRMALDGSDAPFVYTSHDPYQASDYQVSRANRLMTRLIVARADAVIALSDTERRRNDARFGRALPPQAVIPNGFPSATFHYAPPPEPLPEGMTPGRQHVLFVGQLIPFKGVDVLLRAFARSGVDADLLLVYQNSALEADYRREAAELGVGDRVKFLGIRSSTELAALYRSADVFVSASLAEALPSVVIEALMCGCPVIATEVGGVADILRGEHPMLKPGDEAALAAALRQVLSTPASPERRAEISADAVTRYSPATMVASHAALFHDLLARPGGPRRRRGLGRLIHPVAGAALRRAEPILVGRGLMS